MRTVSAKWWGQKPNESEIKEKWEKKLKMMRVDTSLGSLACRKSKNTES